MLMNNLLRIGVLGVALATTGLCSTATAETLRVMRGSVSAPLNVPMNRAVVVESDIPFAELSIANPGIAEVPGGTRPGIEIAWAGALVLIVIVMVLNLVARIIGRIFAPKTGH